MSRRHGIDDFTDNEKRVFHALLANPDYTDGKIGKTLGLAQSTVTTIKNRLREMGVYRDLWVPMFNWLGCEMLVAIYTNFNPVISVEERAKKTTRTIEVSDEIFFSIGETQKGLSLSVARRYTDIGRINDARTETFAAMDLLEKDYPLEMVFPFELSTVHRFFNYAPLFEKTFGVGEGWGKHREINFPPPPDGFSLEPTDKKILMQMIKKPLATESEIARITGLSRHTVSSHRKKLVSLGVIKKHRIPDLRLLGQGLFVLHHMRFNPKNPPDIGLRGELNAILSPYTIFMVARKFEMLSICVYPDYGEYRKDKNHMLNYLHRTDHIIEAPVSRVFVIDNSIIMKDMVFGNMVEKLLFPV